MKTILSFLALIFPFFLYSQATVGWVHDTRGFAIALDDNQNVYTVDYEYNPGGDIHLTKRNADGVFQWEVIYDNTDLTKFEAATWVETDNLGNIIVTGTVKSGYSNPVNANSIVMKYDPNGNLLWRQVYETYFDGSYTKKCLVDADNNIYVLGMGSGPSGFVTKVKKFSPSGVSLWNFFDNAGIGAAQNFKFTPDNKIVLIGRSVYGSVNGYAKIDLDGNPVWSLPGVFSITAGDAAGDSYGNTYIVHQDYYGGTGHLLKKLNTSGNQVWSSSFTASGQRVEVGTDNQPVISGYVNSSGGGTAFLKFNEAGSLLWSNMDADGSLNLLMHAQMQMDQYNNAYLAAGTLFEMAICKVNSDGSSAYTLTTPGGYANAFRIGNDYNVYVVGGTTAKLLQTAPSKTLNLSLLLEGLYIGNGTMRKAQNGSGNNFTGNTSDLIAVELHDASNYSVIVHTLPNVQLSTNGSAQLSLPSTLSGSYYITVIHRNSIETTTATPVSFTGNMISYTFNNSTKAYGGNLMQTFDGHWVIYSGDINSDGLVDSEDMIEVDNLSSQFASGYLPSDVNGDGVIDSSDMILLDNNTQLLVATQLP